MIDPSEKFVYLGKDPQKPWWRTGEPKPPGSPRDLQWYLNDPWVPSIEARPLADSFLILTLDLRTLKLYARFGNLTAEREKALDKTRRRP
jgi:hypothetical protein